MLIESINGKGKGNSPPPLNLEWKAGKSCWRTRENKKMQKIRQTHLTIFNQFFNGSNFQGFPIYNNFSKDFLKNLMPLPPNTESGYFMSVLKNVPFSISNFPILKDSPVFGASGAYTWSAGEPATLTLFREKGGVSKPRVSKQRVTLRPFAKLFI